MSALTGNRLRETEGATAGVSPAAVQERGGPTSEQTIGPCPLTRGQIYRFSGYRLPSERNHREPLKEAPPAPRPRPEQ